MPFQDVNPHILCSPNTCGSTQPSTGALRAAAALSAAGLGALTVPAGVARVLIAGDDDPAGRDAAARLHERCRAGGLAATVVAPEHGDFNDDLLALGPQTLGARLAAAERA